MDSFSNAPVNLSSVWESRQNGAYRPLENMINASMHDDSSSKHLSTMYGRILTDGPYATVQITFCGTNAFEGGKETVSARVDLRTGNTVLIEGN